MDEFIAKRIDELIRRADRGYAVGSHFLNESECIKTELYLRNKLGDLNMRFFGGYKGAQRRKLFLYPDYYEFENVCDSIRSVEIKGSGYVTHKHSSYLGALMALGIERGRLGDIVMKDNSAVLFADSHMIDFLLSFPPPLERVGRDTVALSEFFPDDDFETAPEFKKIFDTVASPRLDAVVGCLVSLSRDKAKKLILCGDVQVNYLVNRKCDFELKDGDIVTVKSFGKYRIASIGDKTKKNRNRLLAEKYM